MIVVKQLRDWRYCLALLASISLVLWLSGWFFWQWNASDYRQPLYFFFILPCWILCFARIDLTKSFIKEPICLGAIVLCFWALITLSYSQQETGIVHWVESLRYSVFIIGLVFGIYILRSYISNISLWIVWAIIIAGMISGLYYLGSYLLEVGPAANMARLDPGLAFAHNTNRVSNIYACTLIAGAAIALMSRIKYAQWIGSTSALISMILILWTQSRSGMLSALIVLLCMLGYKRNWWLMILCFVIIVSIALTMLLGDLGSRNLLDMQNVISRIMMYEEGVVRAIKNPILGEGAWIIWPEMYEGRWPHPHNIYLHIWLQGGIVAIVMFFLLLIYVFKTGYLLIARNVHNFSFIAFACLSMLLYYLIQNLFTVREIFTKPDLSWLLFWIPVAILGSEYYMFKHKKISN